MNGLVVVDGAVFVNHSYSGPWGIPRRDQGPAAIMAAPLVPATAVLATAVKGVFERDAAAPRNAPTLRNTPLPNRARSATLPVVWVGLPPFSLTGSNPRFALLYLPSCLFGYICGISLLCCVYVAAAYIGLFVILLLL